MKIHKRSLFADRLVQTRWWKGPIMGCSTILESTGFRDSWGRGKGEIDVLFWAWKTNVKVWRRDCDALDGGVHEKCWWLPLPLRRHFPHQVAFFSTLWRVFLSCGPREEFEEMFDTTAYERVRTKYHAEGCWENRKLERIIFSCTGSFPHLYDKTKIYKYNIDII